MRRGASPRPLPTLPLPVGLCLLASLSAAGCANASGGGDAQPGDDFLDRLVAIESMVGGDGRSLYGRPHGPQWAPDGSRILVEGRGSLWEVPAEGGDAVEVPVRGGIPAYSPDGRWLAFTAGGEIRLLERAGPGEALQLTRLGASVSSMAWSPESDAIAFSGNRFGSQDLWVVSVPGGEVRQLTSDARMDGFPAWSPDGRTVYFQRMDEWWVDHDILAVPREGGDLRLVASDRDFFDYTYGSRFGQPQVSADGAFIMFPSFRSGWINQWIVPVAGGDVRAVGADEADQDYAAFSPDASSVAYTSNHEGTLRLNVASVDGQGSRVLFDPGLGFIHSPRWSPDGSSIAFIMGTPTRPQELYRISAEGGDPVRLTHSSPDPSIEEELVVPEKIRYPSADGLSIPAYLYRPPGLGEGERIPAIIRLHGGPTAQYYDHLERNVQYYVHRGFAVLLPNVRGSSGFGWDFEHGNDGCWARCDLADVVAGAEYLKGLPFVDGERLGVYGRSYGAYLTMAAIAFAPGVFQAAIPRAGYSDRLRYMEETAQSGIRLLRYEMGPFEENVDAYRAMSPLFHLGKATTPTMVIEGAVRPRLFGGGSEPGTDTNIAFVRELRRLGKVVEYRAYLRPQDGTAAYPGEKPRMLREKADFFDAHLRSPVSASLARVVQ
jgi:dipeptidyl aminopeptidase/acylaminoacyl peptidase